MGAGVSAAAGVWTGVTRWPLAAGVISALASTFARLLSRAASSAAVLDFFSTPAGFFLSLDAGDGERDDPDDDEEEEEEEESESEPDELEELEELEDSSFLERLPIAVGARF